MRTRTVLLGVLLLMFPLFGGPVQAQGLCGPIYTVVEGDTLFSIARRCGVSVEQILAANPGVPDPNRILVGQRLVLPSGGPNIYVVREGETLFSIAQRFGTTVEALLAVNPGITDPNRILAGQVLVIHDPGFRPPPRTPTPFPPVGVASVTLSPNSGPPGTVVQVFGAGLTGNATVNVLLGRSFGELSVVATVVADAQGRALAHVSIPVTAQPAERWLVLMSTVAQLPISALAEFLVVGQPIPPTPTPTPTATPGVAIEVRLYAIALGAGDIGCGDAVVPGVVRDILPTRAPLPAALDELLALGPAIPDRSDLYNALGQSDLRVEAVDLVGDTAIVRLVGTLQIGGVCDEPRVRAQLESTVLQFAAVRDTIIFINGTRLDDLLGGAGLTQPGVSARCVEVDAVLARGRVSRTHPT
ncbi:MAG TPA: LysM peptidoglycan-binding domain-containing protein [Chloroflexi bacterium]|jgi:LysM repeat protein|nr:LysM peptidoglycan-binding domain-containing protein [Chloroflexota bacterium]